MRAWIPAVGVLVKKKVHTWEITHRKHLHFQSMTEWGWGGVELSQVLY